MIPGVKLCVGPRAGLRKRANEDESAGASKRRAALSNVTNVPVAAAQATGAKSGGLVQPDLRAFVNMTEMPPPASATATPTLPSLPGITVDSTEVDSVEAVLDEPMVVDTHPMVVESAPVPNAEPIM